MQLGWYKTIFGTRQLFIGRLYVGIGRNFDGLIISWCNSGGWDLDKFDNSGRYFNILRVGHKY